MAQYVYSLSGIRLDDSKKYLIETRLADLLQETGSASYNELYFKVRSDPTKALQRKMVDAMTIKETSFFRDSSPFELLQHKILPDLIDKRNQSKFGAAPVPIRIWSAACSTGQEIYSIAITLKELLIDLKGYNIRLLGTDISDAAVAHASRGIYNKIEIERGLTPDKINKYFTKIGDTWKVHDEIRAMATFSTLNLMASFAGIGKFDIVFCRNVAIYFTEADKIAVFNKIATAMEHDGYLVIGSTESLSGLCPQFDSKRYLRSVFYQLKD